MDLWNSIFNIKKLNRQKPAKGKVLIAEPFMLDPNFKRSVVYLCDHDENGTFGLILNKPLDIDPASAFKKFPKINTKIFYGGPVANDSLFYIHTMGDIVPESQKINENLWLGGDFDVISKLLEKGSMKLSEIKFFIGYSGWGSGQLDFEMSENAWIVADATLDDILSQNADDLWNNMLSRMGDDYKKLTLVPRNPILN
ncbi:MAG: UPF0301 protein [Vicingaceae bacterium]|nr:MAG: UPF0301 protein [Vicingaceae bacterium]